MNEGNKGHSDDQDAGRTADSVEGWLRGLGQRGPSHDAVNDRPRRSPGIGARRASGDDEAEAFLRAVRRLASSPQGQQALAARLSGDDPGSSDPELNALAQVFASLGRELGRQVTPSLRRIRKAVQQQRQFARATLEIREFSAVRRHAL